MKNAPVHIHRPIIPQADPIRLMRQVGRSVWRKVSEAVGESVVRAWFVGAHPWLDNDSPANAPPRLEQRGLPLVLMSVEAGDARDHQASGDALGLLPRGERGEVDLGDLGAGDPGAGGLVKDRVG